MSFGTLNEMCTLWQISQKGKKKKKSRKWRDAQIGEAVKRCQRPGTRHAARGKRVAEKHLSKGESG